MHPSVKAMWNEFMASQSPAVPAKRDARYSAWQFGYGKEMGDELAALVLSGRKRATAGALWSYEAEGDDIPVAGDFSLILDGSGEASCIIRTVSVRVIPFSKVDADFAAAEGEGDLSLDYWREGHRHFFTRDLEGLGLEFTEEMPVVCERFEVVWPV